jgi:hypothetical protein
MMNKVYFILFFGFSLPDRLPPFSVTMDLVATPSTWLLYLFSIYKLFLITTAHTGSDVLKLQTDLLANYSKLVRPRLNQSHPVDVDLTFYLSSIIGLPQAQMITVAGWFNIVWTDEYLTWDAAMYNGIDHIYLPTDDIWTPDIVQQDSVSGVITSVGYNPEGFYKAEVYEDGSVVWYPGGTYSTVCQMQIQLYPFDFQTCNFTFGLWWSKSNEVRLNSSLWENRLNHFSPHNHWDFDKFGSIDYEDKHISYVDYNIRLLRRSQTFAILNTYVPAVLLTFLNVFVFLIPCESGEKTGFAVTAYLTYSVYMVVVSDSIPSNGLFVPYISMYITFSHAMSVVIAICTIVQVRAYHIYEERPQAIPKALISLYMRFNCCDISDRSSNRVRATSNRRGKPVDASDVDVKQGVEIDTDDVKSPTEFSVSTPYVAPAKSNQTDTECDIVSILFVVDYILFLVCFSIILVFSISFAVLLRVEFLEEKYREQWWMLNKALKDLK